MGFTTGFLGGVTLTTTLLYLSVHLHMQNRLQQSLLLRQQSLLLENTVSHNAPPPPPVRRVPREGALERAKDRWNAELEDNVRKVYAVDWNGVRENAEETIAAVWGRLMQRGREGVDEATGKAADRLRAREG